MAEPKTQDISVLLDQAIETWNRKNPGKKIGLSTDQIAKLSQTPDEQLTPAMRRSLETAEAAWAEAQRQESFAGKVTDFLNSPAGLLLVTGASFIPGGGLLGGGAKAAGAAGKVAKGGLGLRALLGGAKAVGKAGAVGALGKAVGGGAKKIGPALGKAAPKIAKRAGVGAGIGAGAEVAREVVGGEFPKPKSIAAAGATGAVAGQVPGGPITRALAAGVGGPTAGSIASSLEEPSAGAISTGAPVSPPPEGGLPESQTIDDLVSTGNEQAIMAQYQQWLTENPAAAQELIRKWAAARKTPTTTPTGAVLEVPKPTAITLKDESGAPVMGPDGKPIQLAWNGQTGQYDPLPVRITETDEGGNQIERTIDPLTGKESRRFLTRNPIKKNVGGREVFVDPETGNVISATDRPPVEQTIGGKRVLIDPDTGEIVERFAAEDRPPVEQTIGGRRMLIDPDTGEVVERFDTEEETKRKRFETSLPLLQQIATMFSQPSSRLRFLAQEGKKAGATTVPDFSLLDILGSILGGGDTTQIAKAFGVGAGGSAFTVSPKLSEILGLPAGSPLPIGGVKLSKLPSPQALSGLTPDERAELDAILEVTTGGTRLADVERKQQELTPPGGLRGASARFVR